MALHEKLRPSCPGCSAKRKSLLTVAFAYRKGSGDQSLGILRYRSQKTTLARSEAVTKLAIRFPRWPVFQWNNILPGILPRVQDAGRFQATVQCNRYGKLIASDHHRRPT